MADDFPACTCQPGLGCNRFSLVNYGIFILRSVWHHVFTLPQRLHRLYEIKKNNARFKIAKNRGLCRGRDKRAPGTELGFVRFPFSHTQKPAVQQGSLARPHQHLWVDTDRSESDSGFSNRWVLPGISFFVSLPETRNENIETLPRFESRVACASRCLPRLNRTYS